MAGKKASHSGENSSNVSFHQSSVPYTLIHKRPVERRRQRIPSHFYGAEKAWNTAIQNHYALERK